MSDIFITRRGGGGPGNIKSIESATVTLAEHEDYAYDGEVKSVTVESVEMNGEPLILGTDYIIDEFTLSASTGGTHYAEALGIRNYCGVARGAWTIAKLPGSVSADRERLVVGGEPGAQSSYELTVTGDGEITAESESPGTVEVSVEGHTLTLTLVQYGETNVTITLHEGENYTGASITVPTVASDFKISYTGTMDEEEISIGGKPCTLYKLTTSGTLTIAGSCRVWACGGGDAGDIGNRYTTKYPTDSLCFKGGNGGAAASGVEVQLDSDEYTVTIGNGGHYNLYIDRAPYHFTPSTTTIRNAQGLVLNAYYGTTYSRGIGTFARSEKTSPSNLTFITYDPAAGQGDAAIPFGELCDGYCAGGGGGAVFDGKTYHNGQSGGSLGGPSIADEQGKGGFSGGGNGEGETYGKSATFYGCGGGGSSISYKDISSVADGTREYGNYSGQGYQGIVLILKE